MLSVIVITRNEAHNIGACLASADFADEWIVVDSGSTDETVALARAAGAEVVERPDWQGFGVQKNRALELARGEWVLSLDADERVTPALRTEIVAAMADGTADGYELTTVTAFYGLPVKYSEYYPNTTAVRLFKRGTARFTDALVHENIRMAATRTARLKAPLQHLSYEDPAAYLRKINQYAALSAQMLYQRGKRGSLRSAIGHAVVAFLKSYLTRRGFLDGRAGLMVAIFAAESTYHKYFQLMLLDRPPRAS